MKSTGTGCSVRVGMPRREDKTWCVPDYALIPQECPVWQIDKYSFLVVLYIFMATLVSSVAIANSNAKPLKPLTIEVVFDRTTDLLSIHARQAPLGKVLHEISTKATSRRATLVISSLEETLLQEIISVKMQRRSFVEALQELLTGFNYILFDSSTTDIQTKATAPPRVKIFLLSKKPQMVFATPMASGCQPESGEEELKKRFIEALQNSDASLATKLAKKLKESEEPCEREKAAVALAEVVVQALTDKNFHRFSNALAALHELAPESATAQLADLMRDQSQDSRTRRLAAHALLEIRDQGAIEPLTVTLHDPDPELRQTAANALAYMGGDAAGGVLFQALREEDIEVGQAAARAIIAAGDEQARTTLQREVSAGRIGDELLSQGLLDTLDNRKRAMRKNDIERR